MDARSIAQRIVADASRDSAEAALPLTRRRKLSGLRSQSNCFGGVGWRRSIAVFLIGVGFCFPAFADIAPVIYSQDFDLPIPKPDISDPCVSKGWMEDAIIQVPHHFTIYDLNVGISLTHTSAFDLQIFLKGPTNEKICLNRYDFNEFFKGENYKGTVFDDEAEVPIEEGKPPFAGRFRPESDNLLESFDDQDAYGTWRLQIYDARYSDTGTFNHLELIFNAPEPASALLMTFGATSLTLLRRRGHERR